MVVSAADGALPTGRSGRVSRRRAVSRGGDRRVGDRRALFPGRPAGLATHEGFSTGERAPRPVATLVRPLAPGTPKKVPPRPKSGGSAAGGVASEIAASTPSHAS